MTFPIPHRAAAVLTAFLFAAAARADDAGPAATLPDARVFLEAVRAVLHSDETLLSEYTFLEKHVEKRLDGKGRVKSQKIEDYEVYPSSKPGRIYRRLVTVNGKPVDPRQLAEEDRKHDEKQEKRQEKLDNESPAERERRLVREADARRKEQEVVDELFRMDDIRITGREAIDGRSAVRVTFRPRPGFQAQTKGGKVLQKLAGSAWVDEEEHQVVRIDAELLEPLGVGPGGVFRLQKGAQAYFERRRVNGEIWLPSSARFVGDAKVLLFVLGRLDAFSEYSDYRKFSVTTSSEVAAEPSTN